jgi:hypothetical protein
MKLRLRNITDTNATLRLDEEGVVTVNCADAGAVALQIARAANRDHIFDALVAALSPFRSDEMGGLLVSMIDIREPKAEEAERRLRRLVSMIDVILNSVEAVEYDDADAA